MTVIYLEVKPDKMQKEAMYSLLSFNGFTAEMLTF